ncbi:MAG: hypothetical protein K0R38_592 [Polyangiaceae bacterium]|jgi:hypothetical protein|nr:hypothetical protein [Polyangiaceae bacterium]
MDTPRRRSGLVLTACGSGLAFIYASTWAFSALITGPLMVGWLGLIGLLLVPVVLVLWIAGACQLLSDERARRGSRRR